MRDDITPGTLRTVEACDNCGQQTWCSADALVIDADGVERVGRASWCSNWCNVPSAPQNTSRSPT